MIQRQKKLYPFELIKYLSFLTRNALRNSLRCFCNRNEVFPEHFFSLESVFYVFRNCKCGPIGLSNFFDLVYCWTFFFGGLRLHAFIEQMDGRGKFYKSVFQRMVFCRTHILAYGVLACGIFFGMVGF